MPQPPSDDEIAARLRKVVEDLDKTDLELPGVPTQEEIDARLGRARKATSPDGNSALPDVPTIDFKRNNPARTPDGDPSNYRGLGVGITAAYVLVGCMVLGFGIGWLIDRATHGIAAQPIGALLGCVAGIAAVIWLVNRPDPGTKGPGSKK